MVERKGVQYLIESLEGWEGHPEVNVVGDGPYLDTLRSLARQKRVDVNFLGFVDNKSDRFKELLEDIDLLRLYVIGRELVVAGGTRCFVALVDYDNAGAVLQTSLTDHYE